MYPLLSISYMDSSASSKARKGLEKTHIPQLVVDLVTHPSYAPLDDIAEVLVVDVVVLLSDRPLGTFLQLILPVTGGFLSTVIDQTGVWPLTL